MTLLAAPLAARERTPLSDRALDGGVISAETLGRGNTIASNRADPGAGSQNPAALADSAVNASFSTGLVGTSGGISDDVIASSDPLHGRVLQYFSFQGEKGVLFYEPLSRVRERHVIDTASPSTDYRDVEYSADAFGFAGAERLGAGSIGLSIAYLHSSIGVTEKRAGTPDKLSYDTADGLRLNIGIRYPTGPSMWGLLVQNAPGILWGKDYDRNLLPVIVRAGNTVRIAKGILFSVDYERRFYKEGSNAESYYYTGLETFLSDYAVLRGGFFGTDLYKPDERTATGGITFISKTGARISYAIEIYKLDEQRVKRSYVSLQAPFDGGSSGSK